MTPNSCSVRPEKFHPYVWWCQVGLKMSQRSLLRRGDDTLVSWFSSFQTLRCSKMNFQTKTKIRIYGRPGHSFTGGWDHLRRGGPTSWHHPQNTEHWPGHSLIFFVIVQFWFWILNFTSEITKNSQPAAGTTEHWPGQSIHSSFCNSHLWIII